MILIFRRPIQLLVWVIALGLSGLAHGQSAFSWSGFYIGGNGGGSWANFDTRSFSDSVTVKPLGLPATTLLIPAPGFDKTDGTFLGGGQVGYNFQIGCFVLGMEGDFDGTSASAARSIFVPTGVLTLAGLTAERSMESNWIGSARLRAGFAWQRFLFYATGGGAFADVTVRARDSYSPGDLSIASSNDNTVAGWTAGVGAEWAVAKQVSLGLEYRHSGFGRDSYSFASGGSQISPHSASVRFSDDQVTLRVNLLLSGLLGR